MATTASVFSPTLPVLAESFNRSLLAENKSPKTIKAYLGRAHLGHRACLDLAFGNAPLPERLKTSVTVIRRRRLPPRQLIRDERLYMFPLDSAGRMAFQDDG